MHGSYICALHGICQTVASDSYGWMFDVHQLNMFIDIVHQVYGLFRVVADLRKFDLGNITKDHWIYTVVPPSNLVQLTAINQECLAQKQMKEEELESLQSWLTSLQEQNDLLNQGLAAEHTKPIEDACLK